MKKQQHYVITLGRKYGSGGGEVAKKLSQKLGIPYYDKEILQMVADESGIKESYFHVADERAGDKILYKIILVVVVLKVNLVFDKLHNVISNSL